MLKKARNIAGLHYPDVGRSGRKHGCIKPGIQFSWHMNDIAEFSVSKNKNFLI